MEHELDSSQKNAVKKKITAAIKLYHRDFREEAELFYSYVAQKKNSFDDVVHTDHAIERALFEMPENLHGLIAMNLEPQELVWFKTKDGGRWFAKTFDKYALVSKEKI